MDYFNTPSPSPTSARPDGTQAIARAAALLREIALCEQGEGGLAELAGRLGLERPTAYRILRRLVSEGLVQQNPATRGYGLGPLLFELGLTAQAPVQLQSLAGEALSALAEASGDTAFGLIRSGLDSVCVDRREGSYPVKALMMNVGRRRPMGTGAGSLALLAAMPPAQATQILDANAARIHQQGDTDVATLKAVVAQGHAEGFVLRMPVNAPEILSVGVAVCNPYGTPVMGLSLSALKFRIDQRLDYLLDLLREHKTAFEAQLAQLHPRAYQAGPIQT